MFHFLILPLIHVTTTTESFDQMRSKLSDLLKSSLGDLTDIKSSGHVRSTKSEYHKIPEPSGIDVDPECFMNTTQLIADNGYQSETHTVITPDGYILQIFRIIPKKAGSPVVFFQHGLSSSSDFFLLNRETSFPFILTEKGYDVWLGNVRGNIYSLNHTLLPLDSHDFWDFSFQEMAEIDLPAMVDKVLEVTGRKKLIYLGHSQGTQMGFIGFSTNPQLADKISLSMALAPIARLTYGRGLLSIIKHFVGANWLLYWVLGDSQFNPPSEFHNFIATHLCPETSIITGLCESWDSITKGFDISNINETRFPVYSTHSDESTSSKDIIHWAQIIQYQQIQKFDYGKDENMERYNSTKPPVYDISKITVPTVLVAGGNDWLGDSRDVMWLISTIHHVLVDVIFIDKYNHDDYIQGMDSPELVFKPLMRIMEKYAECDERKGGEGREKNKGEVHRKDRESESEQYLDKDQPLKQSQFFGLTEHDHEGQDDLTATKWEMNDWRFG